MIPKYITEKEEKKNYIWIKVNKLKLKQAHLNHSRVLCDL
jgi:hypothetical protein